jgi:ubiquinone/menaquinone biosynthesis C-methylase UbiE
MEERMKVLEVGSGAGDVSFVESDLTDLVLDDTFDAVVGRYILQHLRDPVLALRQLLRHLRPGGIVALQEADLTRWGPVFLSIVLSDILSIVCQL